jgi:DNA-directed RNA polymerase specialized sigma24 family protein
MATGLSEAAFEKLLTHLDADRSSAGQRYEDLRRMLVRFFEWRGAPFPDEHADETFDRVARRLGEGTDVRNIGGYCYSVAKLILLETRKTSEPRRLPVEAERLPADDNPSDDTDLKERRLACLEGCLDELPPDGRQLILEYYRQDKRARIDARRVLASRLGIRLEALANRAQRLRDKLERCVTGCTGTKSAT